MSSLPPATVQGWFSGMDREQLRFCNIGNSGHATMGVFGNDGK